MLSTKNFAIILGRFTCFSAYRLLGKIYIKHIKLNNWEKFSQIEGCHRGVQK